MAAPPLSTFAGFATEAGNKIVQDWYNGLCDEDRDEISDKVNYLASMPITEWRRPEFDKVTFPLAEIRCKCNLTKHIIRIYGVFDEKIRGRFILLNWTVGKNKSYDKGGQELALRRLALLKSGKGSTHEFAFEIGTIKPNSPQQGSSQNARILQFGQGNRKPN